MLKHFHLTQRQWRGILKWSLHSLLFLLVLTFQDVVLAKHPVFGVKLSLVPLLLICVCIREGPEGGGLFTLLAALFWCLSGADYGNVSLAVVPIGAILSSILLRSVFQPGILTTALCCLAVGLCNDLLIFGFKLVFSSVAIRYLWQTLLPGAVLSLCGLLPIYPVVRAIHKLAPGAAAEKTKS